MEFSLIPDILASVTSISDVIELFRNHGDYIVAFGSFIPNVFRGIGIGPAKVQEPPPVDYASAARETAAGNLEAARQATKANRINQYTPYGSLIYSQGPNDTWSQTMTLNPEAQATLDREMAMDKQYADIAQSGLNKARSTLENPDLDFSKLPELQGIDFSELPQAPINAGETAQRAMMARLQPQLTQYENELSQRLANQGVTLGSEAYNREMQLAAQRRNDLELQAAREGISLDQAARQNALTEQNLRYGNLADMRGRLLAEQAMAKDRPLNIINALRTGAQVQNPTFQPYAQQATTQGPNMTLAGQLGYQQGLDSFNAQQARQQQAVATAGKLIGSMFGGGGVAGGGGGMPQFIPGMFG